MKTSTKIATKILGGGYHYLKTAEEVYQALGMPNGTEIHFKNDAGEYLNYDGDSFVWGALGANSNWVLYTNGTGETFVIEHVATTKRWNNGWGGGDSIHCNTNTAPDIWKVNAVMENGKLAIAIIEDYNGNTPLEEFASGILDPVDSTGGQEQMTLVEDPYFFTIESFKKEIATLADFEAYFGAGLIFHLYFIDNSGTKWYMKEPERENYDVRFKLDVKEAWALQAWDDNGSLGIGAKGSGEKTLYTSFNDFIHQWNKSECPGNNHCKFKLFVDTGTGLFKVEQLQKTTSGGDPIDDYFDNVAQETSPDNFKCGFINDKKYQWGLEEPPLPIGVINSLTPGKKDVSFDVSYTDKGEYADYYLAEVFLKADGSWVANKRYDDPGDYTDTITGLDPDTEYIFRLKYYDGSYNLLVEQDFTTQPLSIYKTAQEFYDYVGLPLGTKFRVFKTDGSAHICNKGGTSDAYWRDPSIAVQLEVVDNPDGSGVGVEFLNHNISQYMGDCCHDTDKVNWSSSGGANFTRWVIEEADATNKTFFIKNHNSATTSPGEYVGDQAVDTVIKQEPTPVELKVDTTPPLTVITTVAEFDSHFGNPDDFKIFFEDDTGTKHYMSSVGGNNPITFTTDPAGAYVFDVYNKNGISFGTANNSGGSRVINQNTNYIYGRDDGFCNNDNCRHTLHIDPATNLFAVENHGVAGPYWEAKLKDTNKAGYTSNKEVKWGIE